MSKLHRISSLGSLLDKLHINTILARYTTKTIRACGRTKVGVENAQCAKTEGATVLLLVEQSAHPCAILGPILDGPIQGAFLVECLNISR